MKKIAIIGAGNVGSTCAFSLFIKNTADILLIDKVEGLAQGRALDIAQSTSLWGVEANIVGSNGYSELDGSDVIVITAGVPRKPGMSRKDLLGINAAIMSEIIENVNEQAPEAVMIIVANPVDSLTYFCIKHGGFDASKVMGMSGTVDGARLKYFTSKEAEKSPNKINAGVSGPHSDDMVPFIRQIDGEIPEKYLSSTQTEEVFDKTKNAGAQIVNLLKTGSAFYTPGTSAALMAESIIKDTGFKTEASVLLVGQYGINDVCIGVPVILGDGGLREIVKEDFSDKILEQLREVAEKVKTDNKDLPL